MARDQSSKKQFDKAQRHHTPPQPGATRKGTNGQGVTRTDRGEDQPADRKRARKNK